MSVPIMPQLIIATSGVGYTILTSSKQQKREKNAKQFFHWGVEFAARFANTERYTTPNTPAWTHTHRYKPAEFFWVSAETKLVDTQTSVDCDWQEQGQSSGEKTQLIYVTCVIYTAAGFPCSRLLSFALVVCFVLHRQRNSNCLFGSLISVEINKFYGTL